ncbi:hypothetical protein MASR2M66_33290 [Chloroflexota bacterium]
MRVKQRFLFEASGQACVQYKQHNDKIHANETQRKPQALKKGGNTKDFASALDKRYIDAANSSVSPAPNIEHC